MILPEHLTILEVAEWKDRFLSEIDSAAFFELDVSGMKRVDTAGMQLLLAVKKTLQERDKDIKWVGHSESLNHSAQELGLLEVLMLPE